MADRPILFSAPMVQALLAGTKTQTRRALKFQPSAGISIIRKTIRPIDAEPYHAFERRSVYGNYAGELDIKIKRGDRLWVRESGHLLREAYEHDPVMKEDIWRDAAFRHSADNKVVPIRPYDPPIEDWVDDCSRISRPSIHMPRWASRLTLMVTNVSIERLKDISRADARAEGIIQYGRFYGLPDTDWDDAELTAEGAYFRLWDRINGAGAADLNPWVVAYTFSVIKQNIDQIGRAA